MVVKCMQFIYSYSFIKIINSNTVVSVSVFLVLPVMRLADNCMTKVIIGFILIRA